ncbi:bifunctional metallophosphatase/5'-nucleotidase [Halorussus gelatinilyticus]|uniref:Bifunctional metallophosphatase/5'-nucleotidase n=1 Tax=Halorussus gelatinilyticus TaxID=2937524 RepID=A0A8U0IK14_9EURY|nr:bifunctional UDP-sugar hydrolase/5'-nucleotidase [Halorussus gelatinilyticus]UPW01477.1 bifunctional metallophosphatase/5'-nucleotidase [Halorussus gelatinilyticus]
MRQSASLLLILCLVVAGAVPPAAASGSSTHGQTGTAAPAPTAAQAPTNNSTTVTIMSYNDVQTAAAENGTLPRMVTLLNQRRAAHDNPTVVVGGGDEVSPHALSPLSQWRVPVKALNVIDPAAEVVGNHDLDYGFDAVANFSNASEFPWLMANIVDSETGEPIPGTKPYTVVERQGVKVGIVGVADEKIKSKTAVDFAEQGYELKNYSDTASKYATMLKEEKNVDVVVVSAHLGVPVAKNLANTTENVDAIVVGDDEIEYPPAETGGAVIMEAEARAEHVAELNLTVENGNVTEWNGRLLDVTKNVSKNETVSNIITNARKEELSRVAGKTEVELDSRFASNYHDETALGNMIGDSFRAQTGADVAITNAGGIRSNSIYGPGNLTVGDVYNMLPFQNTLVTVELTGEQLEQLLASQIVTLESEEGQQYGAEAKLQVSGVTYEWVGHNGTDDPVRDVWVNGEPLDGDATYNVTVNSYMAGWDDSVLSNATVTSESHMLYGTALLKYVQRNSPVSPTDENRIRRVDAEVETQSVSVSDGTATVELAAPNGTQNVSDFYATTGNASDHLAAESASLSNGTVTVAFDVADLRKLSAGGTVQIYGGYNTSAYERVYFADSVLNAEVSASDVGAETTTTATTTTETETRTETTTSGDETTDTTAETTEKAVSDETETATTGGTSGGVPGFTPATAVVALVAAALLAHRRD